MTLSLNKKFYILAIIITVFFGFFLGFNNGSVSAVSDVTVTVDTSTSENQYLCTGSSCSDFNYLIVSSSNFHSSNYVGIGLQGVFSSVVNFYGPSIVYDISSISSSLTTLIVYKPSSIGFISSDNSFTVTLSEKNPAGGITPEGSLDLDSNGTYDVTNYASVTVNVPTTEIIEDPISRDFQKVFFTIVEHIIPVFGILLVVWFGIDMLSSLIFGRGR